MGTKILVVDDDPDILVGLKNRLQWLGYHVITATDGLPALDLIEREQPALVLLDLELPTLSGLELLKRLPQHSHIPIVIILTAFGSIERAVEAMKLGAYDFITKPFDQEYLKILLKKALEREALVRGVQFLRKCSPAPRLARPLMPPTSIISQIEGSSLGCRDRSGGVGLVFLNIGAEGVGHDKHQIPQDL